MPIALTGVTHGDGLLYADVKGRQIETANSRSASGSPTRPILGTRTRAAGRFPKANKVPANERAEEVARREFREELGIELTGGIPAGGSCPRAKTINAAQGRLLERLELIYGVQRSLTPTGGQSRRQS